MLAQQQRTLVIQFCHDAAIGSTASQLIVPLQADPDHQPADAAKRSHPLRCSFEMLEDLNERLGQLEFAARQFLHLDEDHDGMLTPPEPSRLPAVVIEPRRAISEGLPASVRPPRRP